MKKTWQVLTIAAALVLLALPASAQDTTFRFIPGGANQAVFQSEAALETITGISNAISGVVTVDLANPGNAAGQISIDASTFRTGIDMRDEHVRGENWIDTGAHPQITFALTSVTVDGPLEPATPRTATITGNLSFHGQTHEVTATAQVGYYVVDEETRNNPMLGLTGNALRIEATFPITLADYGISVPPVLDLKVAEQVTIEMRLTGVDAWPDQG